MAEKKTKTSTAKTEKVEVNNDMAEMLVKLQAEMAEMKKQLDEANKAKEEANSKNVDLQELVNALKESSNKENNLPNFVTVVSLIPNTYNLSTEMDGKGNCYTFREAGESKLISFFDIQKIIGISKYREQAEQGFFYILEDDVNAYFRLNKATTTIENIRSILELSTDDCVEKFKKLNPVLQRSLADKMANDIAEGKKLDRNKLSDILDATGIDIDAEAKQLKKIMKK